jgi:hypothetical protein
MTMASPLLPAQEIQFVKTWFEDKNCWFDIQVAQHFGLDRWSETGYVRDGLPRNTLTEFRGVFNLYVVRPYAGFFIDMGIGIMPAPAMRSLKLDRMPAPHQGTRYYLREILSEEGAAGASAQFRMTYGAFGKIPVSESSSVMPYFGVGFLSMPQRKYEALLKEDGSNNQYRAKYVWNGDEYETTGSLGFLTGRLNFKYRFSPKASLLFGLEYTWFLNSPNFYGKFTNTFNENIQREFTVKGNKITMLGISAGISFM